jgi:hypothetical protein
MLESPSVGFAGRPRVRAGHQGAGGGETGVSFGQMLYAGDDLSGEVWDPRGWNLQAEGRDLLFHLAAEAVLAIEIEHPAV